MVGDYKLPFVLCWIKLSLNWTVNIVVHFPGLWDSAIDRTRRTVLPVAGDSSNHDCVLFIDGFQRDEGSGVHMRIPASSSREV